MSETEEIVAKMLRMPCDKHLCDSGGAYGYAYERRQDIDKEESFKLSVQENGDGSVYIEETKSLYRYLCEYLEHDPVIQAAWDQFIDMKSLGSWGSDVTTEFIEYLCGTADEMPDNTYNFETCLSGTFLYHEFKLGDIWYILIATHNGCDARSGYSDTFAFRYKYEDSREDFWICMTEGEITCACGQCNVLLGGSCTQTMEKDGTWELKDNKLVCTKCYETIEAIS